MWQGPFDIELPPDPPAEQVPPLEAGWEPWAVRRVALAALRSLVRTLAAYLWLVGGVLWLVAWLGLAQQVAWVIAAIFAWFAIDLNQGFVREFKAHATNLSAIYAMVKATPAWLGFSFDYEAFLGCWRVRIVSSEALRALAAQKDTGNHDHDESES